MERKLVVSSVRLLNETKLAKAVDTKLTDEPLIKAFMAAVEGVLDKGKDKDLPDEVKTTYNTLFDELGFQEAKEETTTPPKKDAPKKDAPKKTPPKKEEAKKEEAKKEVAKKEVAPPKGKVLVPEVVDDLSFANCPDDYEELKAQAKRLEVTSAVSFMLLGQRLLKIRDNELYKEDGYSDFKAFIIGELKIGRTTAYNAIDVVNYFGVQLTEHNVAPNAVIPALPLLKAPDDIISKADKKDVKATVLKEAKGKTEKEMKEVVRGLKVKYGMLSEVAVTTDKMESAFEKLLAAIPDELTTSDRKKIQKFVKKLEDLLD